MADVHYILPRLTFLNMDLDITKYIFCIKKIEK